MKIDDQVIITDGRVGYAVDNGKVIYTKLFIKSGETKKIEINFNFIEESNFKMDDNKLFYLRLDINKKTR